MRSLIDRVLIKLMPLFLIVLIFLLICNILILILLVIDSFLFRAHAVLFVVARSPLVSLARNTDMNLLNPWLPPVILFFLPILREWLIEVLDVVLFLGLENIESLLLPRMPIFVLDIPVRFLLFDLVLLAGGAIALALVYELIVFGVGLIQLLLQ